MHRILAALFLATAACSGGGPTGPRDPDQPPPTADRFALSTSALSFAPSENEQTVRLENHGADPVPWRSEASAGWLTVTPSGGSLPPGEALARIVIQRASLPIGTHSAEARFYLDEVLFMVAVTAENPGQALARVQPAAVRLGPDTGAATVTVSNAGSAPLAWSMSGPAWLSIQPAQGTLAPGSSLPLALAPDRSGLSDGLHEGSVALTSDGGSLAVAVSVEVASPAHLRLSPTAVDFGTSASTRSVTIVNEGGRALDWSATEDAPWLTLSATSGSVAPHASQAITLAAARSGLDDGEHQTTLTVSSNGGEDALTVRIDAVGANPPPPPPPPPPSPPPPTSVAIEGRMVDQFTGAGMAGLTVAFAGATAVTDATGRFSVPGQSSSSLQPLDVSGGSMHRRRTFARSGNASWDVIPGGFDMTAFNDLAREYEPRTIRWTSVPSVYIDITAHNFPGGGAVVPGNWVTEIENAVAARMAEWSDGAIVPGSVTVGSSPPPEGMPGTLVIQFDEDAARYPSTRTVGLARTYWGGSRAISSARIWLRFSGLSDAGTRRAVFTHELGHTMGMGHMNGSTASIMTPVVSSSSLTGFDLAAGDFVYGRSPGNSNPDTDDAATFTGLLIPAGRPVGSYHWVCGDPAHGSPETTPPIP